MTTEYTDHFRLNLPDFRMGPWHDLVNEDFILIDGLLFSLYQGVDTQTWANNTLYKPGTTAIDPADNTFWVAIVEHTSAPTGTFEEDRTAHPGYWNRVVVGIAPRGEWQNSTHYLPNDMVSDSVEHVIAVCKTEHTSNASGTIRDDAAYWTFIADIGDVAAIAATVSYDNTASGAAGTNLQDTTDDLYAKNASQQSAIDANTAATTDHGPRITALETSDSAQTAAITTNASNITNLTTRVTAVEGSDTAQNTRLTNLETSNATKIPDAPADGVTYARRDHAWIDVLSVAGASVLVSDTPPADARDSSLWWESDTGQLYIKYNDGDTSQWVVAVPQLDAGSFIAKSGDTMTGPLILSGDPTNVLGAATKQYAERGSRRSTRAITGADTLVAADIGKQIICSGGSYTLAIAPAATLLDGWFCDIYYVGSGVLTIDPNGSETLDGIATGTMYPQESFRIWTGGANFATSHHAGDWVAYIPVISSTGGGAPTTSSLTARYKKVRTSVHVEVNVGISSAGGSNYLTIGLPVPSANLISYAQLAGQEQAVNGKSLGVTIQTLTNMNLRYYDNGATCGASGPMYSVSGIYECAKNA